MKGIKKDITVNLTRTKFDQFKLWVSHRLRRCTTWCPYCITEAEESMRSRQWAKELIDSI